MKHRHHDRSAPRCRFLKAFPLLFAVLYLTGCTALPARIAGPRTALSEEAGRALLAAGNPGIVVTAEAQVTVDGPQGKYTHTVTLAAAEPSSLRVESMPLLGLPDFYLVAKDGIMRIFLPGSGKYYLADASPENLFRFFGISLPVPDTLRLLAGSAPLFPEGTRYEGYCEGGRCRVDAFFGGERIASAELQAGGRLDTIQVFTGEGEPWYAASFDDDGQEGAPSPPRHIAIMIEEPEKTSIELRYRNIAIRPETDAGSLFELPVPPGVTVESPAD